LISESSFLRTIESTSPHDGQIAPAINLKPFIQ
jgi:hypothetical protein